MVEVEFRTSPIHGIGIFARRPIPARSAGVWQVDEAMHICDAAALAALEPSLLSFALHGGYLHKPSDKFIWYNDGMQYMNHMANLGANIGLGTWPPAEKDHCVALRDLAIGEELLEDYTFWSDGGVQSRHWLHRFYAEYCPEHFTFLQSLEALKQAA